MDDESESPETFDDSDTAIVATRRDGWTPFARRLFLEVLGETGRVTLACEYAGLTKQSAYALRNRDPLFASGWDAACELARAPLADALYDQAIKGVTETITRDGQVVAERRRLDDAPVVDRGPAPARQALRPRRLAWVASSGAGAPLGPMAVAGRQG
jgi:hypothetical protein